MVSVTNAVLRPAAVQVSITSDLMCPWCWIGLRKLQAAVKQTNVETHITWKPYMLRPQIPEQGAPKGGTPASRVGTHLQQAGQQVGINFTGLTDRTPNTELFHAVMKEILETRGGKEQTAFQEAIFDLYFTQGVFPDTAAMTAAATKLGLDDVVTAFLADETRVATVRRQVAQEAQLASRRGISGVPFFEFNGVPAFSGAQSVSIFATHLQEHAATPQAETQAPTQTRTQEVH